MVGQRRSTRRKSSRLSHACVSHAAPDIHSDTSPCLNMLPDELLLKVFAQLATVHSGCMGNGVQLCYTDRPTGTDCFSTIACTPHAGLRQYPFLGQVCKRWRHLLSEPNSQAQLWQSVVIDFGQELVTSVHRPVKWSNERPAEDEFRAVFASTRISAQRILQFVGQRQHVVQRLVLLNSEGYWSDDNEFVQLGHKHNFSRCCFGVLLGMLHNNLEELRVQQCNNFFASGTETLDAVTCCATRLKKLHLLEMRCHASNHALACLGALTQLEELAVGECSALSDWELVGALMPPVGIPSLPEGWAALRRLRRLALRGHNILRTLPDWLARLPLQSLEISMCRNMVDLQVVSRLASLDTLVLQGMSLELSPDNSTYPHNGRLPDLRPLTRLTCLCLADNRLQSMPSLATLQQLRCLDLSGNAHLQVTKPLTMLATLPNLRLVDLRQIHIEEDGGGCWSEAKCASMLHVVTLSRSLKRRQPPGVVRVDAQ